MFSPKVLDRASVIEFRVTKEEMSAFLNAASIAADISQGEGASMGQSFVQIAQSAIKPSDNPGYFTLELATLFDHLKDVGAEFGYRSAGEILRWTGIVNQLQPDWTKEMIMDAAIMQKLLPKLHGSRKKLRDTLISLAAHCLEPAERTRVIALLDQKFEASTPAKAVYPISFEKLHRMYTNLMSNGFTSYAEA
jgi:5-methylcytosine-specific restriction enzyme B